MSTDGEPSPCGAGLRARHGTDAFYRRRLPHLRATGAAYFVTWRVRGGELDERERNVVADALRHFDGARYVLFAWVVMNDHVHVVFTLNGENRVEDVVHSWKSFSANRLQKLQSRVGAVWQDEYYDRVMRDEAELLDKVRYILGNPLKRWPHLVAYAWVGGALIDEQGAQARVLATSSEATAPVAGTEARPTIEAHNQWKASAASS